MEAFLMSTGVVALAEIGDKTQLLAIVLAARFKKAWPIVWGILAATILNHALAGAVGAWAAQLVSAQTLRWVLAVSFFAMAVWILIPDQIDVDDAPKVPRYGVFLTTVVAFFFAEMGDKTQIATVAMAARESSALWVVVGSTLGMMIANAPAVFLAEKFAAKISLKWVHGVAAALFVIMGLTLVLSAKSL